MGVEVEKMADMLYFKMAARLTANDNVFGNSTKTMTDMEVILVAVPTF